MLNHSSPDGSQSGKFEDVVKVLLKIRIANGSNIISKVTFNAYLFAFDCNRVCVNAKLIFLSLVFAVLRLAKDTKLLNS